MKVLVSLLFFVLVFVFVPSFNQAQGTCVPASSNASIQLQNGFLSSGRNNLNAFQTNSLYICGSQAAIPQFSLPTYADLKSLYFDQNKTVAKRTVTLPGQIDFSVPLYHVTGDLTITNQLNVPTNRASAVFVDGNLILAPMNPSQNPIISDRASSGTVFIVGGDVRVDPSVTEIDVFIITGGTFCSAFSSNLCPLFPAVTQQLLVKGSVVVLNSTYPPKFMRTLTNNSSPAEEIRFDPKFLVLFKDTFSKDLTIWSEIQ